jgi:hypothetical protein
VRWAIGAVAAVLLLGLLLLFRLNTDLARVSVDERGGRRTWTIAGGEAVKLASSEVGADDRYRCEVDGGEYSVDGTPPRGRVSFSGDFTVSADGEGNVTLACLAEPPDGP